MDRTEAPSDRSVTDVSEYTEGANEEAKPEIGGVVAEGSDEVNPPVETATTAEIKRQIQECKPDGIQLQGMAPGAFSTDIKYDQPSWSYDFREEIADTKGANTIASLKTEISNFATTNLDPDFSHSSMKAFCNAVHPTIPHQYAVHDETASAGQKARQLREFLSDHVGRPKYEKIIRLTKDDIAEFLVGLRVVAADLETPVDAVPTTLPSGAEHHIPDHPPARGQLTHHSDVDSESFIPLTGNWQSDIKTQLQTADWYVYELDVTPPVDDESEDIKLLRRHTEGRVQWGESNVKLDGIYRAADVLNHDGAVYYVGQTNDVIDRLERHRRGATYSGSKFPHLFSPTGGVVNITAGDPPQDPEELEQERTNALTEPGTCWAYSN